MEFIKKIEYYFFNRLMNRVIDQILSHHIERIKKSYLKQVSIRFLKEDIERKNDTAFIRYSINLITGEESDQITVQFKQLRNLVEHYVTEFLNDNVIDLLRHEFAHLKFRGETEEHKKWMKEIKLFKKDKKK